MAVLIWYNKKTQGKAAENEAARKGEKDMRKKWLSWALYLVTADLVYKMATRSWGDWPSVWFGFVLGVLFTTWLVRILRRND